MGIGYGPGWTRANNQLGLKKYLHLVFWVRFFRLQAIESPWTSLFVASLCLHHLLRYMEWSKSGFIIGSGGLVRAVTNCPDHPSEPVNNQLDFYNFLCVWKCSFFSIFLDGSDHMAVVIYLQHVQIHCGIFLWTMITCAWVTVKSQLIFEPCTGLFVLEVSYLMLDGQITLSFSFCNSCSPPHSCNGLHYHKTSPFPSISPVRWSWLFKWVGLINQWFTLRRGIKQPGEMGILDMLI